jgi:uncharacterized protein YerC
MSRVSVKKPLAFQKEQTLLERLFAALASLRNWQEAEAFLMEFLTDQELAMLAKRLELFKRINKKQKYKGIMRDLKVTAQTISDAKKKMKRADAYFLRVLRKLQALENRVK